MNLDVKIEKNLLSDNITVNEKGHLCFAGHDTVELAKKYGTPLYIMDERRIRERCNTYQTAMSESFGYGSSPLFASKALCCRRIYEIMKEEGMGIDIVSPGELYTAVRAGFPMEKAYFHGNNKTDADVAFAIDSGIGYFVCDNIEELRAIDREAGARGIIQKILLRITPGIDPHTLAKINTGRVDSKFGAAIETGQAEEITGLALGFANIELCGFHCHIGSQIFETEPFCDAAVIMLSFAAKMKEVYGFETEQINLGGGMGVRYLPEHPQIDYAANIAEIGKAVKKTCAVLGIAQPKILMEPGRSIVADAGMTLYTVGTLKDIPGFKTYVSIDGGMADNPRFALYESPYTVMLANRADEEATCVCTVAGRCCESGDLIQEGVSLPMPARGDTVAVLTTGAYNFAMASNYNRLPRPPIVMLDGEREYIAVRRETYADLMRNDI